MASDDDLRAVTSAGGGFYAVGRKNLTKVSNDGWVWATHSYDGYSDFLACARINDAFVAVGTGGHSDYDAFARGDSPPTNQQNTLRGIAWSGQLAVAVGDNGELVTTPDGLVWTREDPIAPLDFNDVAWSGSAFLAAGELGAIYQSADGRHWSLANAAAPSTINAISARGKGMFVATDDGKILRGSTSTLLPAYDGKSAGLTDIAWGDDGVVAVGAGGLLLTSPDGSCWQQVSGATSENLWSVSAGNGFAVVGDNGTVLFSTDGRKWFVRPPGSRLDLTRAETFGDVTIATGYGGAILTSSDGKEWSRAEVEVTEEESHGFSIQDVAYGNNRFIAVASDGVVFSSTDATHWTRKKAGYDQDFTSVVWAFDKFFVSRADGGIITGPDENSLVELPVSVGTDWYVRLVNSPTVLVAFGGTPMWSTDGASWYPSTRPVFQITDAVWTGTRFLAVSGSVLYQSNGGSRWGIVSTLLRPGKFALATDGSSIIAVGAKGSVATSTDGRFWTEEDTGLNDDSSFLSGVTLVPGGVVAVGMNGALLYRAR